MKQLYKLTHAYLCDLHIIDLCKPHINTTNTTLVVSATPPSQTERQTSNNNYASSLKFHYTEFRQ